VGLDVGLRVVGLAVGLRVVGLDVGLRVVGFDVGLRVVGLAVGLRVVGLDVGLDFGLSHVGLRVVGLDVGLSHVGLDIGLRVVGLAVVGMLVIGTSVPPPQTQQAMFAVNPAFAKSSPSKEHLVALSSISAYHMQLYSTPSLS
jgi:hypothetical protein